MLLANARQCSIIRLLAVKGGPGTDGEVEFLELLMPELGFTVVSHQKQLQTPNQQRTACSLFAAVYWEWTISRARGMALVVTLTQYQKVEYFDNMEQALIVSKEHSQAPNLLRVAVVSCPLKDEADNPVHERLNEKIVQALDVAIDRVEQKGYATASILGDKRRYEEYLEMSHHSSVASQPGEPSPSNSIFSVISRKSCEPQIRVSKRDADASLAQSLTSN